MPSLTSLVTAHGLVLLIDSASTCVQVGLLRREAGAIWRQSSREAGVAIFENAESILTTAGVGLREIGAFVFCEGPGSILGIRTAAIALRTWRCLHSRSNATYAYRSLELVAHDLAGAGTPVPFGVIADARRDAWHMVEAASDRVVGPVRRVPVAELAGYAGALFQPDGFRAWSAPPRAVTAVSYPLSDLWHRQERNDLLHIAPDPEALVHDDSVYAPWTPQIHRAPRPQTT